MASNNCRGPDAGNGVGNARGGIVSRNSWLDEVRPHWDKGVVGPDEGIHGEQKQRLGVVIPLATLICCWGLRGPWISQGYVRAIGQ